MAVVASHAQLDPNAVIATVNGDEIKGAEYFHRLEWYRVDPQNQLARLPVGFLTIKQLITERIVFQMAKEKGVSPTQPEIEAAEKDAIAATPNLLTDIKSQGRPESDLVQDIAYSLAQFNLQTFGITITDQEVEQHYNKYPDEFSTPKKYRVRVIVVQDELEQAAVDKELAAGKSFSDTAQAHSLDVTKAVGGEFGEVSEADLAQTARDALGAIKIGQTTGWVRGASADSPRVKYLLEDVKPSTLKPLDDNLRKQLRRRLMIDKGNVRNSVIKDLTYATVHAKIVINQPEFQRIYDQLLKQMQAHPEGS
jgi:parvulin-like peptidyl-prolyl isomerase